MSLYIGDINKVLMITESGTYANPSGESGTWLGLVGDHTPTEEENVTTIRYTGTSSRNPGMFVRGAQDFEGTISTNLQNFRMFGYAMGSIVDSGSPTPYAHAITEINSNDSWAFTSGANHNFPSFTVYDEHKGQSDGEHEIRKYRGAIINSITFNASQGEPVKSEINYIAQNKWTGSKTTDIVPIADEDTTRPYLWADVQLHLPSGTNITEVTEINWTLNNNIERRHYDNGSRVAENLTPINRDYELSITMDGNSTWGKTLQEQYWNGGSSFNCMIESVLSTGSEQGFIIMSGCRITSFENPSPAEGINEYSITIMPQSCNINTDDLIELHNPW
ncbi:hypothetical protein KAI04_03815 [Candidatus Pacearchaeota archaeon]|nr:hypothetical protein [Candidatus Pacearchaeota archaeon]